MRGEDTANRSQFTEGKDSTGRFEHRATFRLVGHLSKLRDGSRIEIEEIPTPTSLRSALDSLAQQRGIEIRRENTLILVNGIEANALEDLETEIKDRDKIVLIPMFHGG